MAGLTVEYRIPMPFTIDEYRLGQRYTVARTTQQHSEKGNGVELRRHEPCTDDEHGEGTLTEKRVHLGSSLPGWIRSVIPKIFYLTELAWNYYPYTLTQYSCSFLPRFSMSIETRYRGEDAGADDTVFADAAKEDVQVLDIINTELSDKQRKKQPDLDMKTVASRKRPGRGPFGSQPWMVVGKGYPLVTAYRLINVTFRMWPLSDRVQRFLHASSVEILVAAHANAFAWIDDWIDMSEEEVARFEKEQLEQAATQTTSAGEGASQSLAVAEQVEPQAPGAAAPPRTAAL